MTISRLGYSPLLARVVYSGSSPWAGAKVSTSTTRWLHQHHSRCTHAKETASPSLPGHYSSQRYLSKSASLRSTDSTEAILDPTKYATQAVRLAQQAAEQPTFGVGGVLLDKRGTVFTSMHNNVIVNQRINDPTAHGERQIISWYYENAARLPPPSELTLVTSLDPCVMCTGAFLTSGINVAVISHDDRAGIDYLQNQQFLGVPTDLRPLAKKQFSYLGLKGGRPFAGSSSSIFYDRSIPTQLDEESNSAFIQSLPTVQGILANEDPAPVNIANMGPDWPSLKLLQQWWPRAVENVADIKTPGGRVFLLAVLEAIAAAGAVQGAPRNAAALIDPFNNILLAFPYGPSPLDTPFMQLTRAYASCRKLSDPVSDGTLPHPKRCRWVLLNGPGAGPTDVLDLGAYGSTMEERVPPDPDGRPSLSYFVPRQSPDDLKQMIANLPPLYSDTIKIDPVQLPLPGT